MTVIYKRENSAALIDSCKRYAANKGTRKNLARKRCTICNILFETIKQYPHKTCTLCRVDIRGEEYLKNLRTYNTIEELEKHLLKRHSELQRHLDNENKANGVTVKNTPEPKRDINKYL